MYAVGEILRIHCEAETTRVERVVGGYVFVEWPWGVPDPESNVVWDGTVALPRNADSHEWLNTLWRMDPDPQDVMAGDSCLVGIPPTDVKVLKADRYSTPKETGVLPRPTLAIAAVLLTPDQSLDEDAGFRLQVDGPEPVEVKKQGD